MLAFIPWAAHNGKKRATEWAVMHAASAHGFLTSLEALLLFCCNAAKTLAEWGKHFRIQAMLHCNMTHTSDSFASSASSETLQSRKPT
jgi:hypothetical protein